MMYEEVEQSCSLIILGRMGYFTVLEGLKHLASRKSLLVPKGVGTPPPAAEAHRMLK